MNEQPPNNAEPWRNWNGNVTVEPGVLEEPRDLDEVVQTVRKARESGQKVRVVGGGHSWSDLTALRPGGTLIRLDRLRGLVAVDRDAGLVRVLGGTKLADLNEALAAVEMGLSNLGSIDKQSIAGVIATATHGTGMRFGNLSTQVVAMTLVDGRGEVHKLTAADPLMPAARCSIGSLGVITEVTLQCEPAFRLRGVEQKFALDKAIEALPALLEQHEHVKLWWLPHTSTAIVFTQDRTDAPANPKPVQSWLRNHFLKNHFFRTGMATAARLPGGVPAFNKVLAAGSASRVEVVDRSDKVFTFPVHTPHEEMEYAVPADRGLEAFARMREMIAARRIHVGFIVEVRFVRGDDTWLSPAYERDSCYIGALQYKALPSAEYFEQFAALMAEFEGRPHWGKVHHLAAAQLRNLYPRFDDFLGARAQLDPDGIFLNDELRRIFGIEGE